MLNADDRWGIDDLVARYNWSLDTGDTEGWVQTFTEDAVFESPTSGRFEGSKELREFHKEVWTRPATLEAIGRQHRVNNVIVTGDENQAEMKSQFVVVLPNENGGSIHITGTYTDSLRKVNGRWCFASRSIKSP